MQIYGIKSIISNFFLGFFFKLSPKQAICTIFIANSIKNYCCPIKVDRRNKIWLGYHFHGGRVCFLDFKALSRKARALAWHRMPCRGESPGYAYEIKEMTAEAVSFFHYAIYNRLIGHFRARKTVILLNKSNFICNFASDF